MPDCQNVYLRTVPEPENCSYCEDVSLLYDTKVNPFVRGDFAEKCVLKLVEQFSGQCRAIKS